MVGQRMFSRKAERKGVRVAGDLSSKRLVRKHRSRGIHAYYTKGIPAYYTKGIPAYYTKGIHAYYTKGIALWWLDLCITDPRTGDLL